MTLCVPPVEKYWYISLVAEVCNATNTESITLPELLRSCIRRHLLKSSKKNHKKGISLELTL
jgi:hypothetical protein